MAVTILSETGAPPASDRPPNPLRTASIPVSEPGRAGEFRDSRLTPDQRCGGKVPDSGSPALPVVQTLRPVRRSFYLPGFRVGPGSVTGPHQRERGRTHLFGLELAKLS